jgi:hypothetical protein
MRSRKYGDWIRILRTLLLICALSGAPLLAAEDDGLLNWMDYTAQQQLADREAALAKIHTVAEAQARQAQVRAKILELLRGLPNYSGPLNARVTGEIDRPRYTIEKVIFESLPQFYVTANLYVPKEGGKYPGVLRPMGHYEQGKVAEQELDANMAMKGFVVLTYDPIGQGERQQAYDPRVEASLIGGATAQNFQAGGQSVLAGDNFARYRIWDGMRAIDYLEHFHLLCSVSGAKKEAFAVCRGNGLEGLFRCPQQLFVGPGSVAAQDLFDLAPHRLDGIEVRRIGRQIQQPDAGGFEGFPDSPDFVGGQTRARPGEHHLFARRRPGSVSGFGSGLAEAQDSGV